MNPEAIYARYLRQLAARRSVDDALPPVGERVLAYGLLDSVDGVVETDFETHLMSADPPVFMDAVEVYSWRPLEVA